MTADDFLNEFGHFADAPNGIKKLRELILQLAVRGKLVDQDPNDEPASELLKKIEAEKAKLIAEGKIKKQKPLPPIAPDDVPYELPQGWEWVRLGGIFSFEYGDNLPAAKRSNTGEHPVYGSNGVVGTHHTAFVKSACIVIGRKGSAGALNLSLADGCCVTDVAYYCCPPKGLDLAFSFMLFHTLGLDSLGKGIKPGLNRNEAYNLIVATPPLTEQKRIVAKVDQLMKLCDELEARQQERTTARISLNNSCLNALTAPEEDQDKAWSRISNNFNLLYDTPETVVELRKSILQLAVMGRLVSQDPNDEPASVPHATDSSSCDDVVSECEQRYVIPSGWLWIHFKRAGDQRLGKMLDKAKNRGDLQPYLRNTNVQWNRFDLNDVKVMRLNADEEESLRLKKGDLLVCEGGEPGRCALWQNSDKEMYFQKALHRVRAYEGVLPRYLALNLEIDCHNGVLETYFTGATIKHLTGRSLARYTIPLPPLAEQKRIVTKVDTLMTLCDQLEAKLKQSQSDSESLTASIVNHLTEVA